MAEQVAQPANYQPDEAFALRLDSEDELRRYRARFHIPRRADGSPVIYFAGNSLGLQPVAVRDAVEAELDDWARLAVDGHFEGRTPWYSYHEIFRESGARLVGGLPGEVVYMNGLTVNLHLMMVSFYRPTARRYKVVMEEAAFPSDTYAVETQIRSHGFDPQQAMLPVRPGEGQDAIRTQDFEALFEREGDSIALLLLGAVNYYTGQFFDVPRIAAAARSRGIVVGLDLAHAAGNVPLGLHDCEADFAIWCTYKYLNCGPGAVAGCFVHERHARRPDLPRFGGWWGNDPATRFRMHLNEQFVPQAGAAGWQLSNPPILSMAALKASLAIFDEVGMSRLRKKSERLTGYMEFLLNRIPGNAYRIITPPDPAARGAQLSIKVSRGGRELLATLKHEGVVCDYREPDVIRVAPVPLYNTFHEVWRFARILDREAPKSA